MRRILCLHIPYLPTERAWRDGVWADEQRPLVLTRPVGASQVVEQVCPRAQALGLHPGLSLGQAQAIVPQLVALACDPQRDRAALTRLAQWASRFSPSVEPVEPDTLLVDVTGCQLLFGGEENIARQAVAGLVRQGFRARAAIADTVGAAYALAVAATEPITIVSAGQTSAWLTPLPPSALRIDSQTSERLETLGVRTIGDLLMLPRATLPARFGPQLVLRLQQALGEVFEALAPQRSEPPPFARLPFEVPVADWAAIRTAAQQLLADVFRQLRERELALRRLDCVVYYERTPPQVVSIGLARASREERHIAQLLVQRFEQVDLAPGVTGLLLVARETSRWHAGQIELFEPQEPGDDEALGVLIDRLASRVGHDALVRPQLVDDHQPEMAYRYVSVAEAGCEPAGPERRQKEEDNRGELLCRPSAAPDGLGWLPSEGLRPRLLTDAPPGLLHSDASQDGATTPGRTSQDCATRLPRPARLLARPILVRAIALVPDGPPTWFAYQGHEYVVAHAAGPERLETAWWRGPDVRRDYFRVTTETGEQFWLFRALNERQWYLHGIFA